MASPKKIPDRLGEKLRIIRERLGYNGPEMADMVSDDESYVFRQDIHRFEKGEAAPSLIITLRYARLAKVPVEVLIDDKLKLSK